MSDHFRKLCIKVLKNLLGLYLNTLTHMNDNTSCAMYYFRLLVMSCHFYDLRISDSIESHVEHAAIHVEEGKEQLQRAKGYQVRLLEKNVQSVQDGYLRIVSKFRF